LHNTEGIDFVIMTLYGQVCCFGETYCCLLQGGWYRYSLPWDISRLRLWRWRPSNTGRLLSVLYKPHLRSWQYEYYICHFALEVPAKSWILVWPLVSNPCQCSYIARDIVCCSWQMVRESWSPDCH